MENVIRFKKSEQIADANENREQRETTSETGPKWHIRKGARPLNPLVSIIVPVFNEQEAVEVFLNSTQDILLKTGARFELIFVDDGSTDYTVERLLEYAADDKRIRIVRLSRNFGKEAALTAGIDLARGDAVIPMDVDLQDPPELIGEFLAKWKEGYDIVYAVRIIRNSDTVVKRTTAGWFYRLFNKVSQVKIPEHAGDYRLMDRKVVETLKRFPERNRFMKGLFAWVGFSSVSLPYERQMRVTGQTKWNYWKLWNFALDGVVSFSTAPLRLWSYLGAFIAVLAFLYGLFIVIKVLFLGVDVPGYASLMTVVLFLGGMQLLSLGIIGEYLGRLFTEVKGRPIYIVESIYEHPRHDSGNSGDTNDLD